MKTLQAEDIYFTFRKVLKRIMYIQVFLLIVLLADKAFGGGGSSSGYSSYTEPSSTSQSSQHKDVCGHWYLEKVARPMLLANKELASGNCGKAYSYFKQVTQVKEPPDPCKRNESFLAKILKEQTTAISHTEHLKARCEQIKEEPEKKISGNVEVTKEADGSITLKQKK